MNEIVKFLHDVNGDKLSQSDEEVKNRIECILSVCTSLKVFNTYLIIQRQKEAAKFKRSKVQLGWDVFSDDQKRGINEAVDYINTIFAENQLPLLPESYKREI